MFRKSFKSISIVFRYAPGLTILKLFQIGLSAVLAPLSIYFTQRIIDTVSGIITNGDDWNGLILWVGLCIYKLLQIG